MSEKILRALMRLFAIIAKADETTDNSTEVVESYLKNQLNNEQVKEYLGVYNEFLKAQDESAEGEKKKRRLAVSSVKVIVICNQINEELTQRQKYVVLLNLIEFVSAKGLVSDLEMEFLETVSGSFNIPEEEFRQSLELGVKNSTTELSDSANLLFIGSKKPDDRSAAKYFHSDSVSGDLVVQRVNSTGIYLLRYYGKAELFLNGQIITAGRIYIFSPGSSIRSSKVQPVYYSDVVSCFLTDTDDAKLSFAVEKLEFKFKNGKTGLHTLSFSENSGKLIGIMGGSGAGKSTLLNILNGNSAPSSGQVLVNGHNLHKEKKLMEGVIGYVPQDDLLIEELTVYQNLFYNSKLCFNDHSDEKIDELVLGTLSDLGLLETKDLKVGNSLEKTISGGQRKRLNIALELIREPGVLFVDEPTSGLSSRDSENIMDLLKELSLKGKLVFVVIHQPSSEIFKMFDKLLILDNGGYPIYYGNPVESIIYFKTRINQVNANESECITCGNVNPEQIFNIIESKVLDENGNQTKSRRISPKEWNGFYHEKISSTLAAADSGQYEIKNTFKKPGVLKQFKVFTLRDVLSKLSNKQYLFINLLEAPLLACILAFLIKYYKNGQDYTLAGNKNMPAYLFMCVIVALFIGLTVSAEEIIRDRKILKRESFLNLSKGSYLFSKILILFFVSAIQTLTFVLIGNYILEIQGMYLDYWMVLFTTSCCANMLGLNISAAFNSAVTIYILIPFLLIPQILLSGVIVKFEELHPKISSQSVVPVWGEVMTSRWAFEALAVNQFINNDYEKNVYAYEKEISNSGFKKVYWQSKMITLADECAKSLPMNNCAEILKNEISAEMKLTPQFVFKAFDKLKNELDAGTQTEIKDYLLAVKKHYTERYDKAYKAKDNWLSAQQENEASKAEFANLFNRSQNNNLEDLAKNTASDLDAVIVENNRLVATGDPIFRDGPADKLVRAHFLAPQKSVFGALHSTYWVNIGVIWFMALVMWFTLYFDLLRKLLEFFESFFLKFKRKKT